MIIDTLFDWAERARITDPAPSIEAAKDTANVLTQRRRQFLEALKRLGTATANEVAELACEGNYSLRESIRKRAHELVRLGLVDQVGLKRCSVSGREVAAYRAVSNGEQATQLHK